jgi:hypothetical protein
MLSGLVGALKPILASLLIGSAAVAVVAPAFDMAASQRAAESRAAHGPEATPEPNEDDPDAEEPMPDFKVLLAECLDTREPDSDACAAAALESGMTYEEFRAKIVAKLGLETPGDASATPKSEAEPKEEPKAEPKEEPQPEPMKKPEPVVVKKTEPAKSTANDFATWFEKCLQTRDINSDACFRAEELSGLSFGDFEAKFNSKLAARDGNDFGTWFEKCLQSRDVFSEPCAKAQELIGYNDADFQAKFDRYLAERDRTTKATPKPTAKTYLTTSMMDECGKTHLRSSDACIKALALSGMKADDFWAKMTAKYGTFN